MCGIAGIIVTDRIRDDERAALDVMLRRQRHRGPDDGGRYDADHVALGHRRLSVIDLSGGHQPLSNESGSIRAVVNGEFYNFRRLRETLLARGHRLSTAGDAECLVHLYEDSGAQCVESLDGMFAFALWDARTGTAVLARDRLGVKPLYYHLDDRRLVFASELKALLAVPGIPTEIEPTALADYFAFGFIPSPKTVFRSIRKLPPGHTLVYRDGRAIVHRYWDLAFQGWTDSPPDTVAEQLWDQLDRATRQRLVADVPIGALLSGGLDSTAVVAAMTQSRSGPTVTITCGFEAEAFDERLQARQAAERLGTEHHDAIVHPAAEEVLDALAWHFDEPFADPSAIPMYYLCERGRRLFTVALSGDGGDESLAGYRRYRFDRNEDRVRQWMPSVLRRELFGRLAAHYPNPPWLPRPLRACSTLRNLSSDAPTAHGLSICTMHPDAARRLLHPDVARSLRDHDPLDIVRAYYRRCDAPDPVSKCQYVDLQLGLADGILTKVDRTSMAHGLEVRSPMLDHRFIEFAWTVPPRQRMRGPTGKLPLRRALRRHVGDWAARRPKAGFDVPLDAWFRRSLREQFEDEVLAANARIAQWTDVDTIRDLWQRHLTGRQNNGPTLWKLVMFERWASRFLTDHTTDHRPHGKRERSCAPA